MGSLNLSDEEMGFVSDVLGMWIEGIEQEVTSLANESDDEAHWSRFQLRRQLETARRLRLRIQIEQGEHNGRIGVD